MYESTKAIRILNSIPNKTTGKKSKFLPTSDRLLFYLSGYHVSLGFFDQSHSRGGAHAQRHGLLQVHEAAAQKPRVIGAENVGDHQACSYCPKYQLQVRLTKHHL